MRNRFSGITLAILLSISGLTGCGGINPEHHLSGPSANAPSANALIVNASSVNAPSESRSHTNAKYSQPKTDQAQAVSPAVSVPADSTKLQEQGSGQSNTTETAVQSMHSSSSSNAEDTLPLQGSTVENTGSGNMQDNPQPSAISPSGNQSDVASVQEIFSVPVGEVALTIDDGPSPYTEQIISVLNHYHAKATFFFVGNEVTQYPNAVRAAVVSGDEIGDHTVTHPQLSQLTEARQAQEIEQCAKDIELYDPMPITLFRPPYELMNRDTMRILVRDHMKLALWNRDPRDWAVKTPEQIVHAVLQGNPSGGVFDLHDKQLTLEALPAILQGLQAMHLKIVIL
jgi:peptidoglycan/xylan/chitin deacetylase (PgdA/CDA1 family)